MISLAAADIRLLQDEDLPAVRGARARPMYLYPGPMEAARNADITQWQVYSYSAQGDRQSFSQVLFAMLNIPELKGTEGSRITMHQLLRLLYIDQATPYTEVFVQETFDQQATRQAVGELLLGIYDHRVYEGRLRVRDLEAQLANAKSQLQTIFRVLIDDPTVLTAELVEERISLLTERRRALYEKLKSQQERPSDPPSTDSRDAALHDLKTKLGSVRAQLVMLNREEADLRVDIADSQLFIASLADRIAALRDSSLAQELLGEIPFRYCPACLTPLSERGAELCAVCGVPRGEATVTENRLRMQTELRQQALESERRLGEMHARFSAMQGEIAATSRENETLALRYEQMAASAEPSASFASGELFRELGALDQEIDHVGRSLKLALRVKDLEQEQVRLAAELESLRTEISAREAVQEARRLEVSDTIARLTAELLSRDLPREEDFAHPETVTFDLAANTVRVNGRNNFAASSMVYLKNAFHFALFLAATKHSYMRLPRFMLFDNVEDKGMEPERSHNFQELVVEYSAAVKVDHQLILLTSMLSPSLENTTALIHPAYNHDAKSLALN